MKESIWSFFRNSGKKHLFLTGRRQIGKSTVLNALLEQGIDYGGIMTRAIREGQNMPSYILLQDICDESINAVIGRRDKQGNMTPCLQGFEQTGICILSHCLNSETEWIVIDEIGYLENGSDSFKAIIRNCLQKKRVIAVLRKGMTSFLKELYIRKDALLIDLDEYYSFL